MAEVYHNNIIDIDLESGTLFRSFLNHTIGSGDNNANWYGVRVFRKGEPIALSGCSVQGLFMPASGSAILISDGTHTWVSGNEAAVLLPQACYNVKGRFTLTIKIIGTNSYSITDTVRIIDGVVADTYSANPVAPTAAVPTYQEILAVYDQMVAAKDGSVRFDIEQELTAAQMTQARGNIAAASESDVSDLKSAFDNIDALVGFNYTDGKYIERSGTVGNNANFKMSQLIPCKGYSSAKVICCSDNSSVCGVAFYTQDRVYLSGLSNFGTQGELIEIVVPNNAFYIRISVRKNNRGYIYFGDSVIAPIAETVYSHSDDIKRLDAATTQFNVGRKAIDYPSDFVFTSSIKPLIFYDGVSCSTDYDAIKYKQIGGRIIYVSNNGSSNEQGLTKEKPTTFGKAITLATTGDTIYILDDIDREHTTAQKISNKSINIEGNGHYIFDGNFIEITKSSGYTNVYYATRSLANGVFDVTDKNNIVSFRKVSSIDEVDATPASYYATSSTVYIHPVNVDGKHLFTVKNNIWLNFDNEDSNVDIYVHDLTLFGCYHGCHVYRTDSSHSVTVCFDKCNFLYGGNVENSDNGVSVHRGTSAIFYKCNACHSGRDGINYAGGGSHGVEIDCVCAWNGIGTDEHTMNGSTGHEGAKIIRINGSYFENNGANLADVQSGSQSYNICCVTMTPSAPRSNAYNQNISAQQSGATMWLKDCIAVGARYDLWCAADASLIAENCAHDTQGGITTNIIDTDPISPSVIIAKGFMKKGIIPFH